MTAKELLYLLQIASDGSDSSYIRELISHLSKHNPSNEIDTDGHYILSCANPGSVEEVEEVVPIMELPDALKID